MMFAFDQNSYEYILIRAKKSKNSFLPDLTLINEFECNNWLLLFKLSLIDGGGDDDSTEPGSLNIPWVLESSGVSKKFKLNSDPASKLTSFVDWTSTKLEFIVDDSILKISILIKLF